jgi:hypothetical protein
MSNVTFHQVWPGVDISWLPANYNYNFTNCTLAAQWGSRTAAVGTDDDDYPIAISIDFIRSGLDASTNATNQEIYAYFYFDLLYGDHGRSRLAQLMGDFAFNTCYAEVCPLLRWQGNSDIAGRGVSDSTFVSITTNSCRCW